MKTLAKAALLAAAVFAFGAGSASAEGEGPGAQRLRPCFQNSDWRGWSAPTENILYLRVRTNDIYRVDLSAGSSALKWPTNHLVNTVRGVATVCSAIDLDLAVSDGNGFYTPLIAQSIRKLTPEEIAAIPKRDLP